MKKERVFIIATILVFFLFPVSALEISSNKLIFDQGETFTAIIEGNILEPIAKSDVGFYEEHVQKPFDFEIAKIDDAYYIYAILPYAEKNYNLIVKDVYFKENNQFQTQDLQLNFTISNLTADFNIDPGFLITTKNFTITLYNNKNSVLKIDYSFTDINYTVSLPIQDSETITITTDHIMETITLPLILTSENTQYNIPIQVIKPEINKGNTRPITSKGVNLEFSILSLEGVLNLGAPYEYEISISNLGELPSGEVIFLVTEELADILVFDYIALEDILPGEEVLFSFIIDPIIEGEFLGGIIAESEYSTAIIDVSLLIGQGLESTSSINEPTTCSELQGIICAQGDVCNGNNRNSADNVFCCIGECINLIEDDESNNNTTAIVVVLVLLLLVLGFIGYRMKKGRARKDPMKKRISKLT